MTSEEYVQLKAFARVDGALLSLLWVGSFACYILGMKSQLMGVTAIFLAVMSPFFVAKRLRLFRDHALEGLLSFMRGWAYVILTFFYAGLLFALAQYGYFAFLDHGYLLMKLEEMMTTPEFGTLMSQYGMGDAVSQMMDQFREVRPIDFALHGLSTNIMLGILLGLPIAALMRRTEKIVNR